jgi:hypothetical protein
MSNSSIDKTMPQPGRLSPSHGEYHERKFIFLYGDLTSTVILLEREKEALVFFPA